jgi:chromosome segregation ATPase
MLGSNMKNRIGVIILVLVVVCAGLGIALIAVKNQATQQHRVLSDSNTSLSNKWVEASDQLERQKQTNATLEKDREERLKVMDSLTNNYAHLLVNYVDTSNTLAKTQIELKTSQDEIAKRDAKIQELTVQNQNLDKQAIDLSTAITNLTTEIDETKRKLAASEGEKGFLEKELKRMMAEKAELERQFNDVNVLRAQLSKLKSEMAVARRLDWIRRGLFASTEEKGAQKLIQPQPMLEAQAPPRNYDLNVEVNADGSVRVIPPLTNRATATPRPGK